MKTDKQSYWYKTEIEYCVLCGIEHKDRYRVYDKPKPKDPGKRIEVKEFACGIHFC